jgi:hypothetical protein
MTKVPQNDAKQPPHPLNEQQDYRPPKPQSLVNPAGGGKKK